MGVESYFFLEFLSKYSNINKISLNIIYKLYTINIGKYNLFSILNSTFLTNT